MLLVDKPFDRMRIRVAWMRSLPPTASTRRYRTVELVCRLHRLGRHLMVRIALLPLVGNLLHMVLIGGLEKTTPPVVLKVVLLRLDMLQWRKTRTLANFPTNRPLRKLASNCPVLLVKIFPPVIHKCWTDRTLRFFLKTDNPLPDNSSTFAPKLQANPEPHRSVHKTAPDQHHHSR